LEPTARKLKPTVSAGWRSKVNVGPIAVALLLMYWTAHMDWPFIENRNNFIVDYHIVYAVLCVYLIVKRAGHVWGLDAWAEKLPFFQEHTALRPLVP
jgi:thiosulfate dehydrogenase [quinone] large subunit